MPTEQEVYRNELLKLGQGYPIYEPDPSGRYDRIRVGDVGFIDEFGFFHSIFNVFREATDINQRYGTPRDFVPLRGPACETYRRTPLRAGPMHSAHVRTIGGSIGTSV